MDLGGMARDGECRSCLKILWCSGLCKGIDLQCISLTFLNVDSRMAAFTCSGAPFQHGYSGHLSVCVEFQASDSGCSWADSWAPCLNAMFCCLQLTSIARFGVRMA